MSRGEDVTIFVVKHPVAEEAWRKRKRRKIEDGVNEGATSGEILGEIHVDSRKLRQCSRYFETCMSERWSSDSATGSSSSSRCEFHLEAHTAMFYYEDCFSRISFPFPKPIPSVTHCIELLKVTSQIQCQEVMELGMQYLTSVPWNGDREKRIRDFCNSGYFAADSGSALKARLDLSSTVNDETHVNYSVLAKKTLNRHLDFALCPHLTGWASPTGCESIIDVIDHRKLFAEAFHSILSATESSLWEYVVTLVKEESEKALIYIKNETVIRYDEQVGEEISKLCWLYELLRGEKVSQVMVDLIVKNEKVDERLRSANRQAQYKWAAMMVHIFEDLLKGDLFLNTSERYSLFMDWKWMVTEEYLDDDVTFLVKLVTNVVSTFPFLEQEEVYLSWFVTHSNNRIVAKSYSKWLKHVVREAAKREPKFQGDNCLSLVTFTGLSR